MSDDRIYSTPLWKRTRKAILERDERRCKIGGSSCTIVATQVDHIVPIVQGGDPFDPANLRASCRACNLGRSRSTRQKWRESKTKITLVTGPPCSGKSTYVENHSAPGDLRIDYDRLAAAIGYERDNKSEHSSVMALRNALLRRVERGEVAAARVWIISTNPNAETIFPFHNLVVLDPGFDECVARAARDGRPSGEIDAIGGWYAARRGLNSSKSSREW